MTRLHKIQEYFVELMRTPLGGLEQTDPEFITLFDASGPQFSERMRVYHNNIVGGLSRALAERHPLLEKLVGAEFLLALARAFVMEHPPKQACLHMYGEGFAEFISNHLQTQTMPYLADIAAMEFAMLQASHAENDTAISASMLTSLPQEELADTVLTLRASARFVRSKFPLLNLRAFCLEPEHVSPPDITPGVLQNFLVLRPEWDVVIVNLSSAEEKFLANAAQGGTLGQGLEQALAINPEFDITFILQRHITLGTFAALPRK